ncbi:MAG: hypothetical protein P1U86_01980 [Verrucomicrobiales bacterium]|nr:hypothetical protein [Verrucomicrobiales bacterium]
MESPRKNRNNHRHRKHSKHGARAFPVSNVHEERSDDQYHDPERCGF